MRAVLIRGAPVSIFGTNLLNVAAGLIGVQVVAWRRFTGRAPNAAGIQVDTYAASVDVEGSFQPVPATLLQQLGLDMTKNYATFYASRDFGDPDRDKAGDLLTYAGLTYKVISKNPWYAQDGWESVMCVQVTNAI